MTATKKKIALRAVKAFHEVTGLNAEYRPEVREGLDRRDGTVRIGNGDRELEFVAEIKRRVNRATVALVERQKTGPDRILLLADYVNPRLATALKDREIPFIDAAGNAFIKEPPLLIFIKGNRPTDEFKIVPARRLFKASGLRLLFVLLNQPGAENNPYRDIAMDAGVALGTVGWVVHDLKDTGFMVELGKKDRRMTQKTDLLRRWVEAYPEQLRPKLMLGTFRADNPQWWKDLTPAEFGAFWGGEIAAALLTGYLKPQKAIIYAPEPPGKLIFKCKLKKDPMGNVEILKPFWHFQWNTAERGLVPPLLVYADLMATGDGRNIECAEMIYAEHLAGLVRED